MDAVVVFAALFLLAKLHDLYLRGGGICLACGGRGKHRPSCPINKE